MQRLTKRNATKQGTTIGMPKAVHAYWKLKEIEDIEDELGIDLILLGKAIKGIWIKNKDSKEPFYVGSPYICFSENNKRELEIQFKVDSVWYYFKDYSKTWALTKEELE